MGPFNALARVGALFGALRRAFGGTFTPAQLVMLFDLNFRPHAHTLRPIEHLAPHAVQVFLGIGMALRHGTRAHQW